MKRIVLLLSVATLMSSTAAAADLGWNSGASPMYSPSPATSWSGFYAGVAGGYGFGAFTRQATGGGPQTNTNAGGFTIGATAGYNVDMGGFVIGAETDLQYAAVGNKGASYGSTYYPGDSDGYFGTIRGRLGVAFDRALVFGTGGFAYGDIGGNKALDTELGLHRDNDTNWGWTLGGGVEYAITDNFTAKVEGLYVNLDTKDNYALSDRVDIRRDTEFGVVRAGVNYKFN